MDEYHLFLHYKEISNMYSVLGVVNYFFTAWVSQFSHSVLPQLPVRYIDGKKGYRSKLDVFNYYIKVSDSSIVEQLESVQ